MHRRVFLESAAGAAFAQRSLKPAPNILFIMPDQWRGMDLGSMGNRQVRTPNLDRLAREGVQFRNAVANTPVCTPARGIRVQQLKKSLNGNAVSPRAVILKKKLKERIGE